MAAAALKWDPGDSAGERTLTTLSSLGRFNGWKVDPQSIGEEAIEVGSGAGHLWEHRTDNIAEIELTNIAYADMDLVDEFLKWANRYGVFTVVVGDGANTYSNCQKAPGTRVTASPPDPQTMDLSVRLTVLNLDGTPLIAAY